MDLFDIDDKEVAEKKLDETPLRSEDPADTEPIWLYWDTGELRVFVDILCFISEFKIITSFAKNLDCINVRMIKFIII